MRPVPSLVALAVTAICCCGQTFDVASIKPSDPAQSRSSIRVEPGGRLHVTGATLRGLLAQAYDLREFEIQGGPLWIATDRFDIEARPGASEVMPDPKSDSERLMFQSAMRRRLAALLADRFQLKTHIDKRETRVYFLTIDKKGLKPGALKDAEVEKGLSTNRSEASGTMTGTGARMEAVARAIANILERPVVDRTGLTAAYDFTLKWTPETAAGGDSGAPSLFTALVEQLGLRLDGGRGMIDMLVVDGVTKPTAN